MECQGECKYSSRCFGDVKNVAVYVIGFRGPFYFNYCQEAIDEDTRRGFRVEIIGAKSIPQMPTGYVFKK